MRRATRCKMTLTPAVREHPSIHRGIKCRTTTIQPAPAHRSMPLDTIRLTRNEFADGTTDFSFCPRHTQCRRSFYNAATAEITAQESEHPKPHGVQVLAAAAGGAPRGITNTGANFFSSQRAVPIGSFTGPESHWWTVKRQPPPWHCRPADRARSTSQGRYRAREALNLVLNSSVAFRLQSAVRWLSHLSRAMSRKANTADPRPL
jgi:hypothetical protein